MIHIKSYVIFKQENHKRRAGVLKQKELVAPLDIRHVVNNTLKEKKAVNEKNMAVMIQLGKERRTKQLGYVFTSEASL